MLERLRQQVSPYRKARLWYVAYSGGLDSHVLLHSLVALKKQDSSLPGLVAVHVNHQLQPAASEWEQHCRDHAAALGVDFHSSRVIVARNGSIETSAREARYQVFSGLMEPGDCLFMAHHQQDQIETFFYRLFRGAGLKGLSSICGERPLGKGILVRPLLGISRQELANYAAQHRLGCIHDPSNDDTAFDRNFIRHELLPVISRRWPSFPVTAQRAIRHIEESSGLLDELAIVDISGLESLPGHETFLRHETLPCHETLPGPHGLGLHGLDKFSFSRQKNLLRYWLGEQGVQLTQRQLHELVIHLVSASRDSNPQLVAGNKIIRRFRQRLYVTDAGLPSGFAPIEWQGAASCEVPGYGKLTLSRPLAITLTVKQRQGGETIRPRGHRHNRKLKTLLQELDIPPWQRANLPLIYCGEEIIAIGNLVYAEGAEKYLQDSEIMVS